MKKTQRFKSIASNVGWFTVFPAILASIAQYYGNDWMQIFIFSIFVVWIIYTEFRIQDLQRKKK